MAEQEKKIHLELRFPARQAELFRILVYNLDYRDEEDPTKYTGPCGVEILYEEEGTAPLGNPVVEFSLWFDKPATAYWFALHLVEARDAWGKWEDVEKQRERGRLSPLEKELSEVLADLEGYGWSLTRLTLLGETWEGKPAEAEEAHEQLVFLQLQIRALDARRVVVRNQMLAAGEQKGGQGHA